jgi:hypothetical protein
MVGLECSHLGAELLGHLVGRVERRSLDAEFLGGTVQRTLHDVGRDFGHAHRDTIDDDALEAVVLGRHVLLFLVVGRSGSVLTACRWILLAFLFWSVSN